MKIALDPYMHRHLPLEELPRLAAELGYEWLDFFEWFKRPRVFPDRIRSFKQALRDHGVGIASLLPMYRWASPHEDERQAAVEHWKRAIQVAVEMEVDTMNSEFGRGPHPERGSCFNCCTGNATIESCEVSWWRSMDELVPIFEREGVNLHIEPHPEDFVETIQPAVDMIRTVNSARVRFLYCSPHTFYFGDDTKAMLRECADVLAHVHVADTFNHKASSGLRYMGGDLRDPIFAVMEMQGGALATVEVSVNIGYGYDVRGEISGERGAASLAESNPIVVKTEAGFAGRVPADWRERFIAAYDTEIAEWIAAATAGGATGPSAWDGYAITVVADAALQAADSGEAVAADLGRRPAFYDA